MLTTATSVVTMPHKFPSNSGSKTAAFHMATELALGPSESPATAVQLSIPSHQNCGNNPNTCTLCWSSSSQSGTLNSVFTKTRTIRIRRSDPSVSLGFSIRGGWEHGIGFFVSDVQPNSIAAKHGLCVGDQILRINGFPLDRIVHDEVIALIRMSSSDLTLRVRSTGIVPLKSGASGEKLTWKRLCIQRSEGSSEVSSFVYTRPRSAASSLTTPSSTNTISSEEHFSDDVHSGDQPIYCSNYNEKHLYIKCHQPGSSLGCSVVNGPTTCPGIFVQNVKEGKLAQKCGLEIGDQIVKVNEVDVSVIGFDGAIALLKSMANLTLLVRKGVARHIFECREQYGTFNSKACPITASSVSDEITSAQYHTCSNAQMTKSPSNDNKLIPLYQESVPSNGNPYASYYHHQYQTIAASANGAVTESSSPRVAQSILDCTNKGTIIVPSQQHFCAAYSAVQISACEKSRCCCKRQRTVTQSVSDHLGLAGGDSSGQLCGLADATYDAGMCTMMLNARHVPGGADHSVLIPNMSASLFTDNTRLDTVTSAMANSIRILQEVREKEEKLVEASRKLNEEHKKLCREKERLENEKKELTERSNKDCSVRGRLDHEYITINSQYNTVSTTTVASVPSALRHSGASNTGPTFSFLEEIKALGENGGKRNLRPVNSNELRLGLSNAKDDKTSTDQTNLDDKDKLRSKTPFALVNQTRKDPDKKRQHELLMEEFRIAHQRMFGASRGDGNSDKENIKNGESTGKINRSDNGEVKENNTKASDESIKAGGNKRCGNSTRPTNLSSTTSLNAKQDQCVISNTAKSTTLKTNENKPTLPPVASSPSSSSSGFLNGKTGTNSAYISSTSVIASSSSSSTAATTLTSSSFQGNSMSTSANNLHHKQHNGASTSATAATTTSDTNNGRIFNQSTVMMPNKHDMDLSRGTSQSNRITIKVLSPKIAN